MQISCTRPARRVLLLAGLALLAGRARAGTTVIDPDAAAAGTDISTFFAAQGVTLSHTLNLATANDSVYALGNYNAANNVFGWNALAAVPSGTPGPPIVPDDHWARTSSPDFMANMNFQVQTASIQVWTDFGATMTAFNASNAAIGSQSIVGNHTGFQTLSFSSTANDISRITVSLNKTPGADFGLLDHLVLTTADTPAVPEPGSLALLAIGGLPLAGLLRRRARSPRRT
jgi:hypothetical protein